MELRKAMRAVRLFVLLFVLSLAGFVAVCHGASEADARSAVVQADQRVSQAYHGVEEAQKAGANVSDLLGTLNDVGVLLSNAHLALEQGSFDAASTLADLSVAKLVGFDGAADGLRDSASQARLVDFELNVVGSSVGTVAVVVGGVLLWWYLKKRQKVRAGGV